MSIRSSFRYHRNNDDLFQQFDQRVKKEYLLLIKLFLWILIITGLGYILRAVIFIPIVKKKLHKHHTIAVIFSENQKRIYERLEKYNLKYPLYDFTSKAETKNGILGFNQWIIMLGILSNPYSCIKELRMVKGDSLLERNTYRVIKAVGLEYIFHEIAQLTEVLIKFNDHGCYSILLLDIANEYKVKTVYIQHAPVSERFPPLHHDLNVLFSKDSFTKYKVEKKEIKTLILSDFRFDIDEIEIEDNDYERRKILVCPNKLDELKIVMDLCKELADEGYRIILRPHPADKRNWYTNSFISVSSNSSIWKDLKEVSFVVTNESAVPLEAIFVNKLCYKCSFFSTSLDNYGFIRKGLILKEYNDKESLVQDINNKAVTFDASKLDYFIGNVKERESQIKLLENEISDLRT